MKSLPLLLAIAALATGPLAAQSIVGSWFTNSAGESKSKAVLTFLANGTYLMAEDGDSDLDPSGKDGMERGTYKWDPVTKVFTNNTIVNTNGQWGLSSEDKLKVLVTDTTLTIGGVKLKKVTSSTSKLVGSWYTKGNGGYALVTFLADGSYMMVQDGAAESDAKSGMEHGTYTWNTSTKVFTRKILRDTNGAWGFSNSAKRTITISGNKLALKVVGDGTFTLTKVVAP